MGFQKSIIKNHALINDAVEDICGLFNEGGIDYRLGGAVSGYLDSCGELVRHHDDIDFNLNEKDIDKAEKCLKKAKIKFNFCDWRFKSPNLIRGVGENGRVIKANTHMHEVHAYPNRNGYGNFHLGFWIYETDPDWVSFKRFYRFATTGQSIVFSYPQRVTEYNKMNTSISFRGIKIPCLSAERLLNLKKAYSEPREKDKFDVSHWENALHLASCNDLLSQTKA